MPNFSPHPEGHAIAFASIKAAITGSVLLTGFFLAAGLIDGKELRIAHFFGVMAGLVGGIALGSIFIGLTLLIVGMPLALLLRGPVASSWGIAVAVACALIAALLIGTLFGNALGGLIILPYAIPAAYFYRNEILLEDSFN